MSADPPASMITGFMGLILARDRISAEFLCAPLRPSRIDPMATRSIPLVTDEQLIELLKKGDRKAGDTLVMRHNRLVARAVYEVVRDLAAVEDLIQEIFMKAFRKAIFTIPSRANSPCG